MKVTFAAFTSWKCRIWFGTLSLDCCLDDETSDNYSRKIYIPDPTFATTGYVGVTPLPTPIQPPSCSTSHNHSCILLVDSARPRRVRRLHMQWRPTATPASGAKALLGLDEIFVSCFVCLNQLVLYYP